MKGVVIELDCWNTPIRSIREENHMRVLLSVLMALLGCISATLPAKAEEPPSITINYLAHSAFVIQTPTGKHLLIDPYADRVWIGYAFPLNVLADAVLISHPHFDHDGGEYQSGRSVWAGKVPVLRWPGRWELDDDTTIYGIKGHHAGTYGREFGQVNTIWRLEIAGLTIVHWGDNGPLTPELAAVIGDVDILMSPALTELSAPFYDSPYSVYSSNSGILVSSQDQAARDPANMRAIGPMSGSPSSDPAGMKAIPEFSMKRGILDPQVLQNVLVNRLASGSL